MCLARRNSHSESDQATPWRLLQRPHSASRKWSPRPFAGSEGATSCEPCMIVQRSHEFRATHTRRQLLFYLAFTKGWRASRRSTTFWMPLLWRSLASSSICEGVFGGCALQRRHWHPVIQSMRVRKAAQGPSPRGPSPTAYCTKQSNAAAQHCAEQSRAPHRTLSIIIVPQSIIIVP